MTRKRKKTWDYIQELEKEGNITEDEKFRAKEDLQKIIDEVNNNLEAILKRKKRSIKIKN